MGDPLAPDHKAEGLRIERRLPGPSTNGADDRFETEDGRVWQHATSECTISTAPVTQGTICGGHIYVARRHGR